MKKKAFIFIFLFTTGFVYAQKNSRDSLQTIINLQRGDTNEVKAILSLVELYFIHPEKSVVTNIDSLFTYLQKGVLLAKRINYLKGEADCYFLFANANGNIGNYGQQILFMLKALHIYEQLKDEDAMADTQVYLQGIYRVSKDYRNSLSHAFAAKKIIEASDMKGIRTFMGLRLTPLIVAEIGETYLEMNKPDSALFYVQKAIGQNLFFYNAKWNYPIYLLARIEDRQGKYSLALATYRSAIPLAVQNKFPKDTADIYNSIAALYKKTGQLDSSIYYAKQITNTWNHTWPVGILLSANSTLAEVYRLKGITDSTLKYTELKDILKDSIYSQEKQKEYQSIIFNEQLNHQEFLSAQKEYKKKILLYILSGGLVVLILIAGILWRNNRYKQKAYSLLEIQKKETDVQKTKVEHTLEELKTTQANLIQKEKMASLGELTAGIAHEIQNPLNFVNNFSEVNTELIAEMKQEIDSGNIQQVKVIANDIEENEQKINHHGKRADAIVKGMLQHSRATTGQKEPTDINSLADEYFRLSYHGLGAKEKDFNATMQTDFDDSIGKINIVPQDIGRVLLNLYNNAFYAVNEKAKQQHSGYEPVVSVNTKKINDKVEIKVSDNGNGISQNIVDKIFQPFFTTKPTGQGTGLGLSLSYDIIKAHRGELKVETKEGESAEFIIILRL